MHLPHDRLRSTDGRRSFETRALVVRQQLGEDPQSGSLNFLVGKRPTCASVLCGIRNGYGLPYKRLHRARFDVPKAPAGAPAVQIARARSESCLRRWERKRDDK